MKRLGRGVLGWIRTSVPDEGYLESTLDDLDELAADSSLDRELTLAEQTAAAGMIVASAGLLVMAAAVVLK